MAIFRKQRGRQVPAEEAPAPETAPRPRPPTLVEQLQAIAAGGPAEEALEPALQAVVAYAGAHAAALCLYDQRHGLLRLASEVGLSDEGCKRVRTIRRGDPNSWEMPLHGLVNRRAYLIESAARNRYVPRLVEASTVRTVACVPIYSGIEPLGSLVLIAVAPRSFGERDIEVLWAPLRELGTMIVATRKHTRPELQPSQPPRVTTAEVAALTGERDRLLADLAARVAERDHAVTELTQRTSELERLRAALDTAAAERVSLSAELKRMRIEAERVGRLTAALADAEHERERLALGLENAAATHAAEVKRATALEHARVQAETAARALAAELAEARRTASERVVAAERAIAERQESITQLEGRLAAAAAALAEERARAEAQELEAQRLAAELQAAGVRELRLREELDAADARQAAVGDAVTTAARAAAREAENARTFAEAELERVRADAEATHALARSLEAALSQERAESNRLAATQRAAAVERDRLASALEEARAEAAAATERLDVQVREATQIAAERQQITATAREQEAAHGTLEAHLAAVAAERDRLRDALEAAHAEHAALKTGTTEVSSLQARFDETLAREAAERTRLADAFAQAQTTLVAFEHAQTLAKHEAMERAAELATVRAELARLRTERDDALARLAEAQAAPPVAIESLTETGSASEPEMQVPVAAEPVPVQVVTMARVARIRETASDKPRIVVVDAVKAWADAAIQGHEVVVVAPDGDLMAEVAQLAPTRVVLNLAVPGALPALATLRAGGCEATLWGCIADAASGRGLPLGLIEPSIHPLDPDAVVASLGTRLVRGNRVITAGADVDALMSLRQALARKGMSVSMAWDAKQALELLGVVRPHAVVVDLDLPRRDGFLITARLATLEAVPHAVLVGGSNGDAPKAFTATLNDPSVGAGVRPLAGVLADLAARETGPVPAIVPAAEARPRIRAVGGPS